MYNTRFGWIYLFIGVKLNRNSVILSPFFHNLDDVVNLRIRGVFKELNDINQRLSFFTSSNYHLKVSNTSTAFAFPIFRIRVKPFQHIECLSWVEKLAHFVTVICNQLKKWKWFSTWKLSDFTIQQCRHFYSKYVCTFSFDTFKEMLLWLLSRYMRIIPFIFLLARCHLGARNILKVLPYPWPSQKVINFSLKISDFQRLDSAKVVYLRVYQAFLMANFVRFFLLIKYLVQLHTSVST